MNGLPGTGVSAPVVVSIVYDRVGMPGPTTAATRNAEVSALKPVVPLLRMR